MAIYEHDPLSIWELGLRWTGYDPDATSVNELSAECRDLLRDLCLAATRFVNPLNADGEEILDVFIPFINLEIPSKTLKALSDAATKRNYERDLLDAVFIQKDQVASWCANHRRPLPWFWCRDDEAAFYVEQWRKQWREDYPFDLPWESTSSPTPTDNLSTAAKDESTVSTPRKAAEPRPLSPKQRDRIAVQDAAKKIWFTHPTMTIVDLIKLKEILLDANGKLYQAKTLRQWVSQVDPRTVAQKTGRPKKKQ